MEIKKVEYEDDKLIEACDHFFTKLKKVEALYDENIIIDEIVNSYKEDLVANNKVIFVSLDNETPVGYIW